METLKKLKEHLTMGCSARYKDDDKKYIIISDCDGNYIFETRKVENFFDDSVPFVYFEGIKVIEKDIYGYLAWNKDDEYCLLDFLVNVSKFLEGAQYV